nr:FecR family protein [Pedobacter panaciterrae]
MPQTDIEELLNKYRSGTISQEEMVVLETWYLKLNPDKITVSDDELELVKADVWANLSQENLKRPIYKIGAKLLAAASIICVISLFTYFMFSSSKEVVPVQTVQTDFPPGGNKAVLSLSNGKKIVLTDSENGVLGKEGDVLVSKSEDGKVTYESSGNNSNEIIYNTLTTPRGGQYQTVLSDGTKVWLNSSSSLEFPVHFIGKERKVLVTGEAYFEVSHDKKRPFIVVSGNQEIKVLGTHFNVSSYPDDIGTATTLLSGSVRITNTKSGQLKMLIPGQAAVIQNGSSQITVNQVNLDEAMAWKNGYFIFDDEKIQTIMKVISRWYDVDIQYMNVNNTDHFGGTFSKSRNLSETLKNIEQLGNIRFELKPGKIIVKN